jgi:hypothetical protein
VTSTFRNERFFLQRVSLKNLRCSLYLLHHLQLRSPRSSSPYLRIFSDYHFALTMSNVPYTDLQKDRQARNRPTHRAQPPGTAIKPVDGALHPNEHKIDETFEARERRNQAAVYLESNEMLIWFANQRNEVRSVRLKASKPFRISSLARRLFGLLRESVAAALS